MPHRTRAVGALALAAAAALLAACGSDATSITPPAPTGAAARACRALDAKLPAKVDGIAATTTDPDSPFTAAWGDIVLTCGGAAPRVPIDAQLYTLDGVSWFPQALPQGGTRFSTVGRTATVTVTVPATHKPEGNAAVDLGEAVKTTVLEK